MLEQVMDFCDNGGIPTKNLDQRIKPLRLSDRDEKDLVAFLRVLSGEGRQDIKPPEKFPE